MPPCKGTVLFSTAIVKPLIALSNCKPGSVHVFRPKLLAECCSEPFLVVLRIQGSLISSQAGTCQTLGNDVVNSRAVGTVLPQGGTLVTQGWVSKTQKHSEADRGGIPYFAVRVVFYVNTVSLHRLCFVDARQNAGTSHRPFTSACLWFRSISLFSSGLDEVHRHLSIKRAAVQPLRCERWSVFRRSSLESSVVFCKHHDTHLNRCS